MPRTEDLWTDIYYKGTEPPVMRGREREEVREAIFSPEQRAYRFFSRFTFTKPTDKMRDAGRRIDSISRRLVVDRPELRVSIHTTFLRGKSVTFESILYCRPSIISSVSVTPTSSFSSIPVDPKYLPPRRDTPKGIMLPEARHDLIGFIPRFAHVRTSAAYAYPSCRCSVR